MTKAPYVEAEAAGNGRNHRSYRPRRIPDADAVKRTVELMARAKRPLFYAGGGVINAGPGAAQSLAALVRRTGYPITNTLMGARVLSGDRPALPRHAGDARHLRGQHGDGRVRSDDRGRRAVRRSGHRPARRFLTRLDQGSDRHRSVLHQQECAGRRRHHRRCGPRARRHHGRVGGERRRARRRGAGGMVAAARCVARPRLPALQELRHRHQTAICPPAAL